MLTGIQCRLIKSGFWGVLMATMAFVHPLQSTPIDSLELARLVCPELLIIPISAVCGQNDGGIELTVTPPDNYTYSWSNGTTTQNLTNVFEGTYTVTVTGSDGCSATAYATVMNWTSGFSLSGSVTDPTAGQNNGAIDLTVTPSGTYTYSWSNGGTTQDLSNLGEGTYNVTVSNSSGCTEVASFNLQNLCDLSTTYTISPGLPFCPGETVTLTLIPTGGTPPYSYLWTNGATTQSITFVAGGVITVDGAVMDANDCIAQVFIHLKSTIWQTFIQGYPTNCGQSNGIVDLTVIGGDTYDYNWSNGANTEDLIDVSAGTYTVTVTSSAGCTATASATVANSNSNLSLSAFPSPNTSCTTPNGSLDLTVNPGGNYTYNWSNGSASEDLSDLAAGTYTVTVTAGGNCTGSASYVVGSSLQLPILSMLPTAATCSQNNGAVDLSVNPSGTFDYNWSNGENTEDLMDVSAGTYTVTVTSSAGCTATASATVANSNSNLSLSAFPSPNTSCTTPNGSLDLTVNPGGNYTYNWSNGSASEDLSDLAAGTYTVTVTAGGNCTASASYVVGSSLQLPILSMLPTAATCSQNNGAVDLSVNPSGTFDYNWSNGENTEDLIDVSAGTYTVTVTSSAGCTATASATVANSNSNLSLSAFPSPNTSCTTPNGSLDLTVNPGGNYTYNWSNGSASEDLSDLAAGTYTVTVTAGGNCTASASYVVGSSLQLPILSMLPTAATCSQNNGSVDLSVNPSGTFDYNWSNGENTEDLMDVSAGTYTVTVTSSAGCTATASATVANSNSNLSLTAFPNPNTSCTTPNGSLDLTVNPGGNYTYNWSNGSASEDLSDLAAGTYTVTVTAGGNCTASASYVVGSSLQLPILSMLPTAATCSQNNGSVDLSVNPSDTYDYNWSTGENAEDLMDVSTGTYSVTVTSSAGCTASVMATVANNSAIFSLSPATTPNTSCATPNGSVDISVSLPGTYTYLWSNNATTEDLQNLAPGSYTVTATDANGCTATTSATVANNSATFSLSPATTPNTSCATPNGAVDVTVSLSGIYTYLWSNNATTEDLQNLSPGIYTVTATDANGCTSTTSATVANNSATFSLSPATTPNTSCATPNGSVDITVSLSGTYTYLWSNNATTEDLQNLSPGSYTVTATDANGCTSTTSATVANNSATFSLSPATTPNTSCATPNGSVDITVSLSGTYTYLWSNNATTEDLQNLSPGSYTVTATDANGCTATTSATVANNSATFSLIPATTPNTSCATPNGAVDVTVSLSGTYTYLWSNNASTEDLQNLAPGSYTVTATDANGCTATTSATVANNSATFSLIPATTPNTSCATPNGSVDVTVSLSGTYAYLWSNNATTEDLQNLAPGSYTVTATDANGCTATTSATVVNNSTVFSLIPATTPNTSCATPNGSVDISVSLSGTYYYLWSNNATTEDLQNLAPGSYTVTATDANGCTATTSATVANNSATFSLIPATTPNTSCATPNGSVDVTVSLSGTYTYLWSNNATTEDLQNLAPGSYTVTATDANGCTSTTSATVANNSAVFLLSSTTTSSTSCATPNGAVDVTVSLSGTYTYLWSNNATTEDLQNLAPGSYTVTATDANGCTATNSATVANNNAAFSLSPATTPNTSCATPNGAVDVTVSLSGTYTYLWSNNASTEDLQNLAPGSYTVTATDANGCTATTSATVANNSATFSLIPATTPNTSCATPNGSVDVTVSLSGTYAYLWSNNATTEDLQNLAPGSYTVTVTDANGCTATTWVIISTNMVLPEINLDPVSTTCNQTNGAIGLNILAGGAPFTFAWSNGNTSQNQHNLLPGTYSVTVSSGNGCTVSDAATVVNLGADFSISANVTPNSSCAQPMGMIDLSVSTTGLFSYVWSNGALSQDLNAIPAGTYSVTVTDNLGCSQQGAYSISESTNPPTIAVDMTPVDCQNEGGSIQIEWVQGGNPPLSYSIDGGQHFEDSAMFEDLLPGTYAVMVEDANACTSTLQVNIPQPIIPVITPLPDIDLELGASQILQVQLQPGFPLSQLDTVIWVPNTGLEFSGNALEDLLHPTVLGIDNQQYSVILSTELGCTTEATFRLNVDTQKGLYAPNVIWPEDPNGDNTAFTLFTKPGSLREILILKVYDRWGNELFSREHFESDNLELGWHGDFRGLPMNPAVFVWWAEVEWVDGQRSIFKGDVTVVR
jgi:hypothetical protein